MGDPTKAHPIGPGGLHLWTILEPHDYTIGDAADVVARALRVRRPLGLVTLKRLLTNHAEKDYRLEPPADLSHPGDRDQDDSRAAADVKAFYVAALETNNLFAGLAMPREDLDHNEPTIRITVERYWTHQQAAGALAAYYPTLPRKQGQRTPYRRMTALAKKHVQPFWFDRPTPSPAYDVWVDVLGRVAIFPVLEPSPSSGESHDTDTDPAATDQEPTVAGGG